MEEASGDNAFGTEQSEGIPYGGALRRDKDVLETIGAFVVRVRIVVREAITKKAGIGVRVRWGGFVGEKSGTRSCGSTVGE